MDKNHPHEKPYELLSALFLAFDVKTAIDLYGGGGSSIISSVVAGIEKITVYEIDKINVEKIKQECANVKNKIREEHEYLKRGLFCIHK